MPFRTEFKSILLRISGDGPILAPRLGQDTTSRALSALKLHRYVCVLYVCMYLPT
jgi:hypothetical protein